MIAGQPERARETLLEGMDAYSRHGHRDWFNEAEDVRLRLERYFPDATG